jgi:pimeloyl-ACP methyl ester carboxylesterase
MSEILTHREDGQGEPLLLLNGGMMSMVAWEPLAAPLAESYRVVRCDFRGQLLSPGEPRPDLAAHVEDLVALLDALEIGKAHLAGTSFGGIVGLLLAARHPQRVASLAAITATDRITEAIWQGTVRLREAALEAAAGGDGGRVHDLIVPTTFTPEFLAAQSAALAFRRRQVAGLPPIWFRGVAAILAALQGLDLRPELPCIQCPTLIVAAENDVTFPPEHSRVLAAGIPGARLEVVPGTSHGLAIEHAPLVLPILRDFLAGSKPPV